MLICIGCWPLMAKRTCIKSGFHDVHALFHIIVHSVHARCLIKCLLDIFSLVWTPMSTKLWGFSCFLIRNMFGSLVVHLTHLAPRAFFMHWSCIAHSHLLHTPLLPLRLQKTRVIDFFFFFLVTKKMVRRRETH